VLLAQLPGIVRIAVGDAGEYMQFLMQKYIKGLENKTAFYLKLVCTSILLFTNYNFMLYSSSTKMKFLVLALVLHVLYGAAGGASKQKAKSVTTLIEAKWEVTPLVLEIAEYLRDENEDFLWEFIDAVSALHPPLAGRGKYKLLLLLAVRCRRQ
jgi:hypothetical protein